MTQQQEISAAFPIPTVILSADHDRAALTRGPRRNLGRGDGSLPWSNADRLAEILRRFAPQNDRSS